MFWVLLIVDFLVMLGLVAFLLLVIRGLSKAVKLRLKKDFVESLSVYDDVIEKREASLAELRAAEAEAKKRPAHAAVSYERTASTGSAAPVSATYASGDFVQTYQQVRDAYSFAPETVVAQVARKVGAAGSASGKRVEAAQRIRAMLDHDTTYQLLVMPAEKQHQVLAQALQGEERTLLNHFKEENETGDALAFSRWLDALIMRESDELEVTVGANANFNASVLGQNRAVTVKHSAGIFEGVQVRAGGQLYDYALQAKDLQ